MESDLDESDDVEESEPIRGLKDPGQPSREDVENHNLTHLPYRNWCDICVRAKAKEDAHKKVSKEDKMRGIPIIAGDYAFPGQNWEPINSTVFVFRDDRTQMTYAISVKSKGLSEDEWLPAMIVKHIE